MRPLSLKDPVTRLRLALVGMLLLVAGGTFGYTFFGLGPFDAFYMTLITISTVGFTEVAELSEGGRAFTAALIVSGLLLVAFTTATFIESVVEGGLARYFGRRRVEQKIAKLRGHWILCGFGRMGELVAREIAGAGKGAPAFVVLDNDPARVQECDAHGYLYVTADATHEEALTAAGIERARGVISMVASDAENVYICLTARQMNPQLTIIARALEERSEAKLRRAGADKVVSPYSVGGHRLAQAVLKPSVAHFLEFAASDDLQLEMGEAAVGEGSGLVGLKLKESGLRNDLDLIVLAIRRADGEMEFNPRAEARLSLGDTLIAMGQHESLAELRRRAGGPVPPKVLRLGGFDEVPPRA